jgi:polyhydroxyalkanoate synthase
MEVLQAAFWSLDPDRTVRKFADCLRLDPDGDKAARFIQLEDWANDGEPLPYPAARELIEDLFGADLPGRGEWTVAGKTLGVEIAAPVLHCTASRDAIAPGATAAEGPTQHLDAGHVGMIVGSARHELHALLRHFLDPLAARRARG